MENWKQIDWANDYEISDLGRVRSNARFVSDGKMGKRIVKEKILKCCKATKGYSRVSIAAPAKNLIVNIHRIVASHFIPNPENKPQVNHINGIKTDNRASNLEWVTNQENRDHAVKNKLIAIGWRLPQTKGDNKIKREVALIYMTGKMNQRELGIKYGVSQQLISIWLRDYNKGLSFGMIGGEAYLEHR